MNLKELDLDTLSILWLVSSKYQELRLAIEAELKIRIEENTNFSREYIFRICKVLNHSLGVSFIPSSEAHKNYGGNITIDLILSEDELLELVINYFSNPPVNTSGQIRAKALVSDKLSTEKIDQLEKIGFHTKDILATTLR